MDIALASGRADSRFAAAIYFARLHVSSRPKKQSSLVFPRRDSRIWLETLVTRG